MKKIFQNTVNLIMLVISIYLISSCSSTSSVANRDQYSSSDWTPVYEPGVRYYYIPDIETYYDVSRRDFIYLDQGQWIYSNELPPMYRSYNLYNGYAVALNKRVYEPWRYHQNYSSSYPRYYYRDRYPTNSGNANIRGYDENVRKPVYSNTPAQSRRSNSTNIQSRPAERPRSSNPQTQPLPSVQQTQPSQPSQPPTVNNRRVGKPVKVTPEMREPTQNPSSQNSEFRRGVRPATPSTNDNRVEQKRTTPEPTTTEQSNSGKRELNKDKKEQDRRR